MKTRNEILRFCVMLLFLATAACGGGKKEETAAGPVAKALPDSAFKVEWGPTDVPSALYPAQSSTVRVTFKNASDQSWPDLASWLPMAAPRGDGTPAPKHSDISAVRLSHRWWDSEMKQPIGDWIGRAELPRPLAPGESATLLVEVTAPTQPGNYKLQFDLVQELVAWFESRGASRLIVPVVVK